MPNGDHRRSHSTSDRSEYGHNPEALGFTPGGGLIVRGVRTPQEFMASLRAIQARSGVRITVPPRRIIFGNLPNATTISDVLCLVYGGAVERVWSVVDGEVIVQFCDDGACRRYYEANSNGITVFGDHVIAIERPEDTDQLTAAQRERINQGMTRVIRITGISNDSFSRLCDLTKGYEIDHIHLVECDKVRQTPFSSEMKVTDESLKPGMIYVFFRNLAHAWDFKVGIEEDTASWGDCVVDYLPDP